MDGCRLSWILAVSPAALWGSAADLGHRVSDELSARSLFFATPSLLADLALRRSM